MSTVIGECPSCGAKARLAWTPLGIGVCGWCVRVNVTGAGRTEAQAISDTENERGAVWCSACDKYPGTVRISDDCTLCSMCAADAIGCGEADHA